MGALGTRKHYSPPGSLGGRRVSFSSRLGWLCPQAGLRLWPGLLALVGASARGPVHSGRCRGSRVSSLQTELAALRLRALAPGASVGMLSESDNQHMHNDS